MGAGQETKCTTVLALLEEFDWALHKQKDGRTFKIYNFTIVVSRIEDIPPDSSPMVSPKKEKAKATTSRKQKEISETPVKKERVKLSVKKESHDSPIKKEEASTPIKKEEASTPINQHWHRYSDEYDDLPTLEELLPKRLVKDLIQSNRKRSHSELSTSLAFRPSSNPPEASPGYFTEALDEASDQALYEDLPPLPPALSTRGKKGAGKKKGRKQKAFQTAFYKAPKRPRIML